MQNLSQTVLNFGECHLKALLKAGRLRAGLLVLVAVLIYSDIRHTMNALLIASFECPLLHTSREIELEIITQYQINVIHHDYVTVNYILSMRFSKSKTKAEM